MILGAPDEATETSNVAARTIRWVYYRYRLTLFFIDESSFGRYRLMPKSRADFERVVARLRRGGEAAERP